MTHLGLDFVFDTGHANLGDGVETGFQLMKDQIRSTHVHDNDGKSDSHLFPLASEGGTIDWKNTMGLLPRRQRAVSAGARIEGAGRPDASAGHGARGVRQTGTNLNGQVTRQESESGRGSVNSDVCLLTFDCSCNDST